MASTEPVTVADTTTTIEATISVFDASETQLGPSSVTTPAKGETQPLSKNQLKKLARKKRFEETRPAWKAAKREKAKARKIKRREERELEAEAGEKRKPPGDGEEEGKCAKRVKTDSDVVKTIAPVPKVVEDITLVMDCGFDDLMTDKEVVSMSSQLTRCYSANKASHRQFEMHVTSLNKRLLARYEGILQNQHLQWKGMTFSNDPYPVTPKEKDNLVYLTADSENTIHELEPGKKYIIGGIVDRNRHKNLSFNKAKEQGIAHGRLPIGEYIKMASRQVLTTNQVVEIMLEWLKERDWGKAFIKVIPQRKLWKLKGKNEGGNEGDTKSEEAGDIHEVGDDEGEQAEEEMNEEEKRGKEGRWSKTEETVPKEIDVGS